MAKPKSICILRLSALGDVIHMVPVVRTLQHHWPDVPITWIIGSLEARLLGDIPGVEFIVSRKESGLKPLRELRRQLKGRRFDVLLHMQVAMRANLLSLCVRAGVRLGFDKGRARDNHGLFINRRIAAKPKQHVMDGFFDFLEALGIEARQERWDIPIPDEAHDFIADKIAVDRPLLVINPCTSSRKRNFRNWRADRYAAVADHAAQRGFQVALSGGPADNERTMAQAIVDQADTEIINLVGVTNLKQLLALLTRADIVVSPDTGPAHMAGAVGTPVVGLYVTSNPKRTGPYRSQQHTVNRYPDAVARYLDTTEDAVKWGKRVRDPDAVDLITVDDVLAKLNPLIDQIQSP